MGEREVPGLGLTCPRPPTSRFGRLTCATAIAAPPCVDFAGAIRSVSAVVAELEPFPFEAVTTTRSVCATSAEPSVKLVEGAPLPSAPPPPAPTRRCHSDANLGPDPDMAGRDVSDGAAAAFPGDPAAATSAAVTAAPTKRSVRLNRIVPSPLQSTDRSTSPRLQAERQARVKTLPGGHSGHMQES